MTISIRQLFTLIMVCACYFSGTLPAASAVWYVATDGSDSNSGQSWDDAFQSIQNAIDNATGYTDEIWVKQGIYYPSDPVVIENQVTLYGGFSGVEVEAGQRDWQKNKTVVDGQGVIDHCFYIERGPSWSQGVVIDGFTITGGNADGGSDDDNGGGIYVDQHRKTVIRNCTFTGNTAAGGTYGGGGAVFIYAVDSPVISNCTFLGNMASGPGSHGGAIHVYSANLKIYGSLFAGNTAGAYGGALFINGSGSGGQVSVTSSTFSANSAREGGAIYNANGADPVIVNSIFWGDSADELAGGNEIQYDTAVTGSVNYCAVDGGGTPGTSWFQNGTGNITADPLFVDATGGDFHLLASSPCIDAGDETVIEPNTFDIDGDPRIIGSRVDLGVDESYRAWYVDAAASPSGNGGSWANAFADMQSALVVAGDNHQVWVKGATYTLAGELVVSRTIDIYGGFAGTERRPNQRNLQENETIIDGGGLSRCLRFSHGVGGRVDGFIMQNCAVTGNGAAILIDGASPTIANAFLRYNLADGMGGAVFVLDGAAPVLVNTVFHGNSAAYGAALAGDGASLLLLNATLTGNMAVLSGGAIWSNDSTFSVANSILWGNAAATDPEISVNGTTSLTVSSSNIANWSGGGVGNISEDPLFQDAAGANFHLQTVSPCIDKGDNSMVLPEFIQDVDGEPRVSDGDEDGTATVDMGADEYIHVPAVWYVDGTLVSGGDGTSWPTAFTTVEAAVENALLRNFDEIWVKAGTYMPPQFGWSGDGLALAKTIGLYGGFPAGMAEPAWSDRNWAAYPTIIDANSAVLSRQRVFDIRPGVGGSLVTDPGYPIIDGFTITGGNHFYGGGITIEQRSPTIANCKIYGNAASNGGGVYALGGAPAIVNSLFAANTADTGSAVFFVWTDGNASLTAPHPKIINSTFTRNIATQEAAGSATVWLWRTDEISIGAEMANNILWDNTLPAGGVEVWIHKDASWTDDTGGTLIHHNIIHNGTQLPWLNNGTGTHANIDANPWFYDENGPDDDLATLGDNDYRPTAYHSINSGDATALPADISDLDGDGKREEGIPFDLARNSRLAWNIDRGAYEPLDTDGDAIPDIIDGAPTEAIVAGDFDNSGGTPDLADVVTALRILAEPSSSGIGFPQADTNNDGLIGIADSLYILINVANQE